MRGVLALAAVCGCLLGSASAQTKAPPQKPSEHEVHDDDLLGAPNEAPETALRTHDLGGACFVIEREPDNAGGLRIPQQVVCPPFAAPEARPEEAPLVPAPSPKRQT